VIEDYHVLQTTRDEYLIRAIRNGVDKRGIPVEFSKGEAGRGQHEINLVYAIRSRWPTATSSTRTRRRRSPSQHGRFVTFMAKYSKPKRSVRRAHIHSSVWNGRRRQALLWEADAPDHLSPVFRGWLGGQVAAARFARGCTRRP
jgi:glutamine synthetase